MIGRGRARGKGISNAIKKFRGAWLLLDVGRWGVRVRSVRNRSGCHRIERDRTCGAGK